MTETTDRILESVRDDVLYTLEGMSNITGVPVSTLRDIVRGGCVRSLMLSVSGRWLIYLDGSDFRRYVQEFGLTYKRR